MAETILFVSSTGRMGGAENSLLQLAGSLDRRRFTPAVAVPEGGELARLLSSDGVRHYHLPEVRLRRSLRPGPLFGGLSRCAAAGIRTASIALHTGASLIHSNTTTAHYVAAIAACLSGVPSIWHVRDMQAPPLLPALAERFTSAVIYCSHAVRRALPLAEMNVPRYVVHNAIHAEAFRRNARPGLFRQEMGFEPDQPLILMAAQMVPWKGHRALLRAMVRISESFPRVRCCLAGGDLFGEHQGYVDELERMVDDLGLADNVLLTGYRKDIATLMTDANLLVAPGAGEPFGRVALESMAVGTPVIAADDAGLAEVIRHGKTGLLVPPEDPASLADAISRLLNDPELSARMGRNGRVTARKRFSLTSHVNRVQKIYTRIFHEPSVRQI
ncbi:MAG: glycosyltransferase family 4 protein [Planctomycetota bacterium]